MKLYFNQTVKCIALIAVTSMLSNCALIQKKALPAKPNANAALLNKQHLQTIEHINTFTINGRLAVITQPKNHSARLKWQHNKHTDHIDIFTPLGGKVAQINKSAESVSLTDHKNNTLSAPDTESLTEEVLGFRLPLSGLNNWALGKPHKQGLVALMTWDNLGHVKTLQQNGWHIQYKNYMEQGGYLLPTKVFMKNDNLTIKLIIDDWFNLPSQP